MRILVDAMGGDNAPLEILKGCKLAADEYGYDIILCGDERRVRRILEENGLVCGKFAFADAPETIEMTDHADAVIKEKKDSSMAVGLRLLKAGEGDAFVTAGNTGAALVGSSLVLRRIKGIKRAAIATILPARNGDEHAHRLRRQRRMQGGILKPVRADGLVVCKGRSRHRVTKSCSAQQRRGADERRAAAGGGV